MVNDELEYLLRHFGNTTVWSVFGQQPWGGIPGVTPFRFIPFRNTSCTDCWLNGVSMGWRVGVGGIVKVDTIISSHVLLVEGIC